MRVFAVPRSMAISVEKNLLNFIRTPAPEFVKFGPIMVLGTGATWKRCLQNKELKRYEN